MKEMSEQSCVKSKPTILLTGATGYVGGRLLPCLLEAGYRVRCAVRHPENLSHIDNPNVEFIKSDLLDYDSLEQALRGADVAFYLVHSLGTASDFEQKERQCAENFTRAAKYSGVERIIYLGGLGSGEDLSPHLKTRHEVGLILRESSITTIEFRASIIIGSGSLSFEMVRSLVDKLPVMITPRWVSAKAQPISIEDVIQYLFSSIEMDLSDSRIFEIGGPDVVSYMDIMREYAKKRGLRRFMIPVPVLTPHLSSLWLGLVTPLYARIGKKLIDSIRNDTLVESNDALTSFSVRPRGLTEAIDRALKNEDREFSQTKWSDALSSTGETPRWGGVKFGSRIVDSRSTTLKCSSEQAFTPIRRIGGTNGWYYADWAWTLRGFLDLLVGGVGVRRGRVKPDSVSVGDAIDFWRVESIEPNRLLRLRAEMKLPGRAWLQFEVKEHGDCCSIHQTAIFDPIGISGLAYWYGLYPFHKLIFAGMLKELGNRAVIQN